MVSCCFILRFFYEFMDQVLFCLPDRVFEQDVSMIKYDFHLRNTIGICCLQTLFWRTEWISTQCPLPAHIFQINICKVYQKIITVNVQKGRLGKMGAWIIIWEHFRCRLDISNYLKPLKFKTEILRALCSLQGLGT